MIEFAFVAMLLFTLLFGIIEFGWILNGYVTLTSAAQEGARKAIVMNSEERNKGEIIDTVRTHARIFNLSEVEEVDIKIDFANEVGEDTIVEVTGDLDLLISFPPFPQSITLATSASMRQEQ